MRTHDRWSLVSLPLGLVLGAGCGLFGLHGDDALVRIECVDGRPALAALYVGEPREELLSSVELDTLSSSCGGEGNPDLAFQLVPLQSGTYDLRLSSEFDAVLYGVESPCDGPRVGDCVDDNGTFATEVLTVELEAGAPYVVVVDGFGSDSQGMFTLEAVLVAVGGETDSDGGGETGEPADCSSIEQTFQATWTGDRWAGAASGTTQGHVDSFPSTCGGTGRSDDAWRFVPPMGGVYRLSVTYGELQGGVSVRNAECTELVCDDGAALSTNPHMPTMETFLDEGVDYTLVVEATGAYELVVEQLPEASLSPTCGEPCAVSEDCTVPELCAPTTEGQICLPEDCVVCFDQGLTCWSYPYTCGFIACS